VRPQRRSVRAANQKVQILTNEKVGKDGPLMMGVGKVITLGKELFSGNLNGEVD
jgi:hypothetical protein